MPRQRATYDPVPPWWYPTPDPPSTPEPAQPDPVPDSPSSSVECDTAASHSDRAAGLDSASPTELLSQIATEPPRVPACAEPGALAEPPRADIGKTDDAPQASVALNADSPGWISDPAVTQLAVRWAIDFCSWDEDNPGRRDVALRRYLDQPTPIRGWSGRGRQRATFAVAGRARLDEIDLDITWVEVETLVTPYEPRPLRALTDSSPRSPLSHSRPSSAPAPDVSGWRPLDSVWMQVLAAVRRLPTGQLVIDPDLDPAQLDELEATPDDLPLADQAL